MEMFPRESQQVLHNNLKNTTLTIQFDRSTYLTNKAMCIAFVKSVYAGEL